MQLKSSLLLCLSLATHLIPTAQACGGLSQRSEDGAYNPMVFGKDCAPKPFAAGYKFNHLALIVNNLTASIDFYTKGIGMTVLFTFKPLEKLPIYIVYMGHNEGLKNSTTPFGSCEEFALKKNSVSGLVELVYYGDSTYRPIPTTALSNTFSHLGLVVPDVKATQDRLEAMNARILKRVGEWDSNNVDEGLNNIYGLGRLAAHFTKAEQKEIWDAFRPAGGERFLFVEDPDGNVLEVEPPDA